MRVRSLDDLFEGAYQLIAVYTMGIRMADIVDAFEHNYPPHSRLAQFPGEGWMVRGYQADASEVGEEKSAWGNLYEERLRGRNAMKTPDEGWRIAKGLAHHGDWNTYEILAEGDHIRLTFNGVVTIDTHDKASSNGIVALQLHQGPEMRVEFRNIKLKALP